MLSSPPRGSCIFRAEVLQQKREERLQLEGSAALREEHRLLMAWNEAENARQRARRWGHGGAARASSPKNPQRAGSGAGEGSLPQSRCVCSGCLRPRGARTQLPCPA